MARRAIGTVFRPTVTRKNATGKRRKRKSKFYWGRFPNEKPFQLRLPNGERITDGEVATARFEAIRQRRDRHAVGLVDREFESAGLPMRKVIADFLRHLRRKRRGAKYVRQARTYARWFVDKGYIANFADFDEKNIDAGLGRLADDRLSPRTINAYREVLSALGTWAVKIAKIASRNPVGDIERRAQAGDVRKQRRALTPAEATQLLAVAGSRQLFYKFQLFTGLRVSEAKALEWRDLHLNGDRPAIQLRAATTKAKRADTLPLHANLAAALNAAKPPFAKPTDRVFQPVPKLDTFKADLRRAGIPFEDATGRTLDRHALRTTFVSWLGAAGVDVRVAQRLSRHTDLRLTTATYQDVRLLDTHGAISKLPDLTEQPQPEVVVLKATGTDDAHPDDPVVRPVALKNGKEGVKASKNDQIAMRCDASKSACLSREKRGFLRGNRASKKIGATGFEPATS